MSKFFKIYVCVSLLIIIILLGSLVGTIAYAGIKVRNETTTVSDKVNQFSKSMDTVNKNLQNINTQLEKQNSAVSGLKTTALP